MSAIACANILVPSSFGEALMQRRETAGLSQIDLVHITGICRQTIWRLENERAQPRPVIRYALRMALGLHENDDGGWWRTDW